MHVLDRAWDQFKKQIDSAFSENVEEARHQLTKELNQSFRRLLQYGREDEWISALVDAASRFASEAALFQLKNGTLTLRKKYNLDLPEDLSFSAESAGAFASAIESKDPVVTLRSVAEVSEGLSLPGASGRAHLFPISNGGRVVAILFAPDGNETDVNGLELLAGMGSAVLERRSNLDILGQIAPAPQPRRASAAKSGLPTGPLPRWADLGEQAQDLHVRAQRFSRVKVAEMQLARPEACQAGRERGDLYLLLKSEIENAREVYRRQFMTIPSMIDYLHLELVMTAAQGDETKLGADYPGQLV